MHPETHKKKTHQYSAVKNIGKNRTARQKAAKKERRLFFANLKYQKEMKRFLRKQAI